MSPFSSKPLSGRFLSFAEREEIALRCAQGAGARQIAYELGRAPSTISRELRRNAATRGGELRHSVAQGKADLVVQRPKVAKLVSNRRLREYVQDRLSGQMSRRDGITVAGPESGPWTGRNTAQLAHDASAECRIRPAFYFIVPSNPISGYRTLKLVGLTQWEHVSSTCCAFVGHRDSSPC